MKELLHLHISKNGEPFCNINATDENLNHLHVTKNGEPWFAPSLGGETIIYSGNIKRVSKVDWGDIKKVTEVSAW